MLNQIEKGKQLGIRLRFEKNQDYFWYCYAVQKRKEIYIVYESEISEKKMAEDLFEYENVKTYSSLEEVKNNFPYKYGTKFEDIHTLKGQVIFNADFYV